LNPAKQHETFLKVITQAMETARKYHQHKVVGIENIPNNRSAIVAVNHSLATYDITLLMTAMYTERGIIPRPLVDRLFFKVPLVGPIAANYFGAVKGNQESAEELLNAGEVITVAPGGMREALRPSQEKYKINWDHRIGFCRLAMKTQTPIILAACPKADDLYDVYPSHLTAWFYKTYKVPVFLAKGLGYTPIPRPVKLTHYCSEPLVPPKWSDDEKKREKNLHSYHQHLIQVMERLMQSGE